MAGLNIGEDALIYPEDLEKLQKANRIGDMLYHLFLHYRSGGSASGLRMYDVYAAAYILDPDMFTAQKTFVGIETKGEFTAGASAVDLDDTLGKTPNATVLVDVDAERFKNCFVCAIENLT